MASTLVLPAQQVGGFAAVQATSMAGKRGRCNVHNTYRPPSVESKDPLLRVSWKAQHPATSAGRARASILSSRSLRTSSFTVRANADDTDMSPRHLDRRQKKGGKEWFEGQQSVHDRAQGLIRGKNWILRRGSKNKAVKSGEAVTDQSNKPELGQRVGGKQDRREGRDGGANLAEYPWTGPAEKTLLDMARTGGQWEPLQIETASPEPSLIDAKEEAVIGATVPEVKPAETAKEAGDGRNWKILIGLFFAFCLMTSADKAAMSVAPMTMAKQFGWLESDKGLIGSSFFFGFMFSQIPSSIVCKRIGRRKIMTWVALWIGVCQLLTPIAASTSLTGLLAVRAALGFGEGVVVPILTSMLADYVPPEKRSSSLAMVFSGGPLGTVLSLFLCPGIINTAGWQPLFYAIGAVSLAWGAAWSFAAPHFEPLPAAKPRWNPFRKAPKANVAPQTATPSVLPAISDATFKLYKDSPLLLETGVKLATLAALGPDGKRIPAAATAVAGASRKSILNGAVVASSDEELVFSPDDPYWKLSPDARRKLRQRRMAIRGRFSQNAPSVSVGSVQQNETAPSVSSPRKQNGIVLPAPHSAQQSLSGSGHVATPPGVLSPIPAEATIPAARRRVGVPHLRPLRSTGTICSSAAVAEARVANDAAPAGAAPAAPPAGGIPWRRFFASRAFWAIAGAHFCSNWGWNAFMAWLPTYFTQKLGLDLAASSTITLIPWTMAFLAGNTSGMLADWMSGLGIHKTKVRKIIQCVAFLGPAAGLALLTRVSSATEAVAVFCGVLALGSFSAGGFCSNHSDISPKHSGTLYALTNTFGCLGGSASVALTGVLLDKTGNWNIVWLGAALMYVIGTLWYVALGSTEKEFD
ncbi:phosphate transporter [Klebsormidium nitens]|uniref:Phosphate transporter n=1 Tax=Klebsormidium nitens TaxID=105231 RepID=A0A1Y1I3L0_KLENI|nr:phosphate transporter [Klebsormidium nitens]|eukprot:GAQ83337.1 phosphate transporter [Klebsormidium nitens]